MCYVQGDVSRTPEEQLEDISFQLIEPLQMNSYARSQGEPVNPDLQSESKDHLNVNHPDLLITTPPYASQDIPPTQASDNIAGVDNVGGTKSTV